MSVAVLGGGAFGQALAKAVERGAGPVTLFSRSTPTNSGFQVHSIHELESVSRFELIFIAVPSSFVCPLARALGRHLDGSHFLVHVSRGLVGEELSTLTEVLRANTPCRRVGVLAGPLSAESLSEGTPCAGVVGTRFVEVAESVSAALCHASIRVYDTSDVIGVEFASAMVGLMALVGGAARELQTSPSAISAVLTRGMAEAQELAKARGGSPDTFAGLAGMGDLLAAILEHERPEARLGALLASGEPLADALKKTQTHVEAVNLARRVAVYGRRLGMKWTVAETVAETLDGEISPRESVARMVSGNASTK
ncbi:MAG: hypothetical protein AAF355_07345 [Myxococcota bacterium]